MITKRLQAAIPDAARHLCEQLQRRGYSAWVVGGCVRDHLLLESSSRTDTEPHADTELHADTEPHADTELRGDWDITTSATPQQVQASFPRVIPTGIEHGTVTVMIGKHGFEVTTFRTESGYRDGRRPSRVSFVDDLKADLARRDFTVNAIAYDPMSDTLVDPFEGVDDLRRRLLRAVGEPEERFREDGLRMLRAARFVATLEFRLDERTEHAIRPSLGSYRKISGERIRDEWQKAMRARRPSLAFDIMMRHGLLAITAPELSACVGYDVEGSRGEDLWTRTLRCVDTCPPRLLLRMAALLHAVGKPQHASEGIAPKATPQSLAAEMARDLVKRLKFSNVDAAHIVALVRHQQIEVVDAASDVAVRRWLRQVTPQLTPDLYALAEARARALGGGGTALQRHVAQLRQRGDRLLAEGVALSTRDLAINGHDLLRELGLSPGRQLGDLLRQLLEEVTETPALNTRERLLQRAKRILAGSDSRP